MPFARAVATINYSRRLANIRYDEQGDIVEYKFSDGRHTVAQIAGELAEEFDVTLEAATRDWRQFIEDLVQQGLLQWRGEPA